MLMFLLNTILVKKIGLMNRMLSIYIIKVNYSWVSNLGEGKLQFSIFVLNWKIKPIDYLY